MNTLIAINAKLAITNTFLYFLSEYESMYAPFHNFEKYLRTQTTSIIIANTRNTMTIMPNFFVILGIKTKKEDKRSIEKNTSTKSTLYKQTKIAAIK